MVEMPGGRAIKAARVLAGLTGKQLAELAKIDPSTLSRLETLGISAVSGKNYEAVLKALSKAGVEIEGDTLRLARKPRR
jgi:transcriptional regulator with XRE-family HTH domain